MNVNSRLTRLIDLVPYISKHQGIAIEELARRFDVSVPELEKDLWLLYCCGLPGQTPLELMEFAFEDGYVSVRNAEELKSPRSLTQIEIATLVMGLDLISKEGNGIALELKKKLQNLISGQISILPDNTQNHIPEIEDAIQNNFLLRILYKGSLREVIPLELYFENFAWYLKAHCKLAKARRTFRLNRIESVEVLDAKELPPNEVIDSVNRYVAKIKIHSHARLAREIFGSTEEISYYSKDWLFRELMAQGGRFEALTPEIRSEIEHLSQAGKNLYLG